MSLSSISTQVLFHALNRQLIAVAKNRYTPLSAGLLYGVFI